jgi:VWFA-related protein
MTATQINGTSRRSYGAVLKYYDKKRDTAVLKIDGGAFDFLEPVPRSARVGQRIYAIGNPKGLEQSITAGIVSGLRRDDDGTWWIQHDAPIWPGSSGGALISSRGELLGINSWMWKDTQGLNFAVPVETLARAYAGAREVPGSLRFPGSPPHEYKIPSAPPVPLDRSLSAPPSPAISQPPSFHDPRADGLVHLNVTVSDKAGNNVTNLPQSAFTVLEDGVPQPIKLFRTGGVPVSQGLILDNSANMRYERRLLEGAALALVSDSHRQDETFVVNFNDEAYLDKDFSNDARELQEALARNYPRGGAAMRDAIRMSIDHLVEKGTKAKRVLVVVTGGNDNSSLISLEGLVRVAQDSGVLIYAIGLLDGVDRREARIARRALLALTKATGGEAFFPSELAGVQMAVQRIMGDIQSQYAISYSPLNQNMDGRFRKISVVVGGPGRPVARTRLGYDAMSGTGSRYRR